MNDYRDDRGAAQARIAQLEEELAERKEHEVETPAELQAPGANPRKDRRAAEKRAPATADAVSYDKRCATSALGPMCGTTSWVMLGTPAALGVVAGLSGWWTSSGLLLVIAAVAGAGMIAGRIAVEVAVPRELAWADSLPFALVDHFDLFGYSDGHFTVHFAGPAPDAASFELLVLGVPVPFGGKLEVRGFGVCMRAGGGTAHTRWRIWRAIVSKVLVPLHERFPIERVTCVPMASVTR